MHVVFGATRPRKRSSFGVLCARAGLPDSNSVVNTQWANIPLISIVLLPVSRIELDGFGHGLPTQIARDIEREKFLLERDIEELRFWNHQWHQNREGVLLEIWHALQRRTGCTQVMCKLKNQTYVPPALEQLG